MRTVTLWGTSNSGTIPGVGTPDFSTGLRSKSTTSTWNSSPQRELTTNPLSGKLGADQPQPVGRDPALPQQPTHQPIIGRGPPRAPRAPPDTHPGPPAPQRADHAGSRRRQERCLRPV